VTRHFFTVDVEEHFQVSAFDSVVSRDDWPAHGSRLDISVPRLLELLDRHEATGTFFVLGWIARHRPAVVRAIAAAGHEIASHGYAHHRVCAMTPAAFREDVRASRLAIEDLTGAPVLGFRAPSFSIVPGTEWAFDVLVEEGFRYDSSLFPIRRRGYGYPSAPRDVHLIRRPAGELLEFPLATTSLAGATVPAAGGGYLRHFPFALIRRAFREASARAVQATLYVHPWEVDPDQPRLDVGLVTRFRHYRGLTRTLPRLDRLLAEFRFTSIASAIPARAAPALATPAEPMRAGR
jgi:polysaccharide deacetylase family protein (PEP-CTERM system associated)